MVISLVHTPVSEAFIIHKLAKLGKMGAIAGTAGLAAVGSGVGAGVGAGLGAGAVVGAGALAAKGNQNFVKPFLTSNSI